MGKGGGGGYVIVALCLGLSLPSSYSLVPPARGAEQKQRKRPFPSAQRGVNSSRPHTTQLSHLKLCSAPYGLVCECAYMRAYTQRSVQAVPWMAQVEARVFGSASRMYQLRHTASICLSRAVRQTLARIMRQERRKVWACEEEQWPFDEMGKKRGAD